MKRSREQQAGIISIMVTMIMMVVITLIVLGFAEVARNEQRNSLDDTLSVQAYYSAESGINDARTDIMTYVKNATAAPSKQGCAPDITTYPSATGTVDPTHSVSYTCLTVNADPHQLFYSLDTSSRIIPINSGSGSIGKLQLEWKVTAPDLSTCPTTSTGPNQYWQAPIGATTGTVW